MNNDLFNLKKLLSIKENEICQLKNRLNLRHKNKLDNIPSPNLIMKYINPELIKKKKNIKKKKVLNMINKLENEVLYDYYNTIKMEIKKKEIKKYKLKNRRKKLSEDLSKNHISLINKYPKKLSTEKLNKIIKTKNSIVKSDRLKNKIILENTNNLIWKNDNNFFKKLSINSNNIKNKNTELISNNLNTIKMSLNNTIISKKNSSISSYKKFNSNKKSISLLKKNIHKGSIKSIKDISPVKIQIIKPNFEPAKNIKISSIFYSIIFIMKLIFKKNKKSRKLKLKSNNFFSKINKSLTSFFTNFFLEDLKGVVEQIIKLNINLDLSIFYESSKKEIQNKKKIIKNIILSIFEILINKLTENKNKDEIQKYLKCILFLINNKNVCPDNFLTEFEINKLKFNYDGYIINYEDNQKLMIIGIFILIKILINEIFLNIENKINIAINKISYTNFFIISNILYITILDYIIKKDPILKYNIIKPESTEKIKIKNKYLNFKYEENYTKDKEIIVGFYSKNQLDYFFSDSKLINIFYKLIEKYLSLNLDLLK